MTFLKCWLLRAKKQVTTGSDIFPGGLRPILGAVPHSHTSSYSPERVGRKTHFKVSLFEAKPYPVDFLKENDTDMCHKGHPNPVWCHVRAHIAWGGVYF